MVQYKNATGTVLEVLRTLRFLFPGHVQPRCALGHHYRCIPVIRLCLQWGRDQTPSKITHAYIQRQPPLIVIRPPVSIGETVNASTLFFLAMETRPEAGHCPSHCHPTQSVLLFLDSQTEASKHASPLTVGGGWWGGVGVGGRMRAC